MATDMWFRKMNTPEPLFQHNDITESVTTLALHLHAQIKIFLVACPGHQGAKQTLLSGALTCGMSSSSSSSLSSSAMGGGWGSGPEVMKFS